MIDARGSSVKKGKGLAPKTKVKKFMKQDLGLGKLKAAPKKTVAKPKPKRTGYTGPQKVMLSAKKRNATTRSAIRQAGR